MAQQGKQMRVGACKGFAYYLVKVVAPANGNRYKVDSKAFLKWKSPLYIQSIVLSQLCTFLDTHWHL
jgi:hypothetical protein